MHRVVEVAGFGGDPSVTQLSLDPDMPIVQQPRTTVVAVVRTRVPVASASLEAVLHELDRTVPVFNDRTVDQILREASSRRRTARTTRQLLRRS